MPRRIPVVVSIEPSTFHALEEYTRGTSRSRIVEAAIVEYLKRRDYKRPEDLPKYTPNGRPIKPFIPKLPPKAQLERDLAPLWQALREETRRRIAGEEAQRRKDAEKWKRLQAREAKREADVRPEDREPPF
ncbi:MAG: hypothetical protein U0166_27285 [Acidobacteriota bacterium]